MSASLLKAQHLVSTRVILKVNAHTKIVLMVSIKLNIYHIIWLKIKAESFKKVANLSFRPRFAHCKYHIYFVSAPITKVSQYQPAIIVLSWTEWNAKINGEIFQNQWHRLKSSTSSTKSSRNFLSWMDTKFLRRTKVDTSFLWKWSTIEIQTRLKSSMARRSSTHILCDGTNKWNSRWAVIRSKSKKHLLLP